MIPIYFVWSQKYKILAELLNKSLNEYTDHFVPMPIFIDQSVFDKECKPSAGHIISGCSVKIAKKYELLCNLPENSYFIFCDADIHVFKDKPFKELIDIYIKLNADLVCMKESMTSPIYNIGFNLIKVNEINRQLYKGILEEFTRVPDSLDQTVFNRDIVNYTGSIYYFSSELVCTTSCLGLLELQKNWQKMKENIIIFQPICNGECSNPIEIKLRQYGVLDIDKLYFNYDIFKSFPHIRNFLEFFNQQ